jgi:hypothetical protein
LFIVAVIVPQDRDELLAYIEDWEVRSGKNKFKWGRAIPEKRLSYLREVFTQRKNSLRIYFSVYRNTREYRDATIETIAKVIRSIDNFQQYKFIIYVDALGEKDQRVYGARLYELGIPSRKVKGIMRDESNGLIRLADSVCGFLRDFIEIGDGRVERIYEKAVHDGILVEV